MYIFYRNHAISPNFAIFPKFNKSDKLREKNLGEIFMTTLKVRLPLFTHEIIV